MARFGGNLFPSSDDRSTSQATHTAKRFAATAILLFVISAGVYAQSADPSTGFGVVPHQTYLGESENINLGTGNVNIQIPLLKLPGRGGHDFTLNLSYNSQIWYVFNYTPPVGQTTHQYANAPGWNLSLPQLMSDGSVPAYGNTQYLCNGNYRVKMWDGRTIYFPYVYTSCFWINGGGEATQVENLIGSSDPPFQSTGNQCSADFAVLETFRTGTTEAKLHLQNGETLWFQSGGLSKDEDANGNVITFAGNTATDTVGRAITFTSSAITYNDSNGTPQTITITWGGYNTNPNFPINQYGEQNQPITVSFVTAVTLPNGDKWQMSYDPDSTGHTYGELTKITYPTGGYTKYDYTFVGTANGDNSGATNLRQVVAKHVCKSYTGSCSTTDDTSITPTPYPLYAGGNSSSSVIDALGNKTTYTFTNSPLFYETIRQAYSGTSTLVETVASAPSCWGSSQETVTLNNNNLVTQKTLPLNLPPYTWYGYQTTSTATSNPVVTTSEYDYGTGSHGPLLRQTLTTLMAVNPFNGQNYTTLPVHVLGRKLSEVVQDGSGNTVAQTQYEYDNYSSTAPHAVITASGATQHDSTYSTSYTTRGNVTATTRWLNTTSSWLQTTNTYDDAGNVLGNTDPRSNTTNFSYADNFTDGTNHSAIANVTKTTYPVTNGVSHIERKQYYFNTALSAASCGQNFPAATACTNSATLPQPDYANFTYDSLGRLILTNVGDGGQTSVCYSDDPGSGCNGSAPQLSVTTTKLITATTSLVNVTLLDGVGRTVQTQLTSDPDGTDYVDIAYDGLGRVLTRSNPRRASGSTTDGTTTYVYDALSRVCAVVQPDGAAVSQCPTTAPRGDVFTQYDVTTTHPGDCTIVTDEVGNQRMSCSDALGRLTGVWEAPNLTSTYNFDTYYTYDTLNNLLSVTQKGGGSSNWRTRTFTYDSLSRLLCAANPEVQAVTCPTSATGTFPFGATLYTYDSNSNVLTKTAPSPNQPSTGTATVTTTYTSYDALNRLTGKSYNDTYTLNPPTPSVAYGYDAVALTGCTKNPPGLADTYPVGRRTTMCDGSGATSWKHDTMGRVLSERRTIGAVAGDFETDTYNLDGSPSSVTTLGYGVSYTYNRAARPITATYYGTNPATKFVSGATYAPPGELATMTMGSTTSFSGIVTNNAYNMRLQPILLSAGVAGQNPVFSLCFDFHLGVAVTAPSPCSFSASTLGNNGNVYQIVNNRSSDRTENFNYDALNRIQQAYSSGSIWGETYSPTATSPGIAPSTPGIDAWGNLTNRSGVIGKNSTDPLACPANTNNHLTTCSLGYDPAGNVTSNGSVSYVYDAENRLIATSGYSYIYDGDGQRVEKCTPQGSTQDTCASGATGTLYWRGIGSDPLSETDLAGSVQNTYVFFNGQRVARSDSTGIHYYFSDHLGTHGVMENATATVCEQDIDYYPYGGVQNDYCALVQQHYKFTGKERDSESNLDYFGARHYASTMGRFMSPDRYNAMLIRQNMEAAGLPSDAAQSFFDGYLENPQSWNQYSYVRNNPLTLVDPTGAAPVDGHHLIISRNVLTGVARDFADSIKTGSLSGSGAPNQPGFNAMHREYNAAVEEVLEEAEQTMGDRNTWSIPQWKDVANQILNSQVPAIRNFLEELEANNPGAKAALSAAIAGYRVSTFFLARTIAAALGSALVRLPLIIYIDVKSAFRRPDLEADRKPPHKRCLMTRDGQCVD
ncbi:MAG TPA: RHS repeat-associated core domain-containing protein [Candidatus Acidoferrum sp.]|jgi:RHS repeat-associated protein|nr:RHS repeat-associated core domain-containing protein [Candidatus Acidoferrum sp.]